MVLLDIMARFPAVHGVLPAAVTESTHSCSPWNWAAIAPPPTQISTVLIAPIAHSRCEWLRYQHHRYGGVLQGAASRLACGHPGDGTTGRFQHGESPMQKDRRRRAPRAVGW